MRKREAPAVQHILSSIFLKNKLITRLGIALYIAIT